MIFIVILHESKLSLQNFSLVADGSMRRKGPRVGYREARRGCFHTKRLQKLRLQELHTGGLTLG